MAIIDGLSKKLTALIQNHVQLTGDYLCYAEDEFQTFIQRSSRNVKSLLSTVVAKEECNYRKETKTTLFIGVFCFFFCFLLFQL